VSDKYSFGVESFTNERIHSKFISLLSEEKKGKLLDVGAGTGALSNKLKSEGFDVSACDINPGNFIPEDINCKEANLNTNFPFDDATFDYAVSAEVIEHIENPWFFVRELYRITKPDGIVIISTPNLHNWYVRLYFVLTSKVYNFLSSYEKIGHITPIFLWNLERMAEGLFDILEVKTSHSIVPKFDISLPFEGLLFGQCIVVKMRRKSKEEYQESRIGGY
jgi:2-polyprenyl-3-methyl-5-hydroxy-6-metoxy-1,4-benzoquinol methylase